MLSRHLNLNGTSYQLAPAETNVMNTVARIRESMRQGEPFAVEIITTNDRTARLMIHPKSVYAWVVTDDPLPN